jgi:hypothetical protein
MKCYFLLLLVAVTQAAVLHRSVRNVKLPVPNLTKLTAIDPMGFKIQWAPVNSESDEIVGYKVLYN